MRTEIIKNFMDRLTRELVPGNSICVYKDNEEIFRYSSGYSDVENKKPMTGDEYINIYSCSKVATVVAALQLLEKGVFLLHEPLEEYFPEFKDMYVKTGNGNVQKAKNKITIWNLFTMTAGFNYEKGEGVAFWDKAMKITNGDMNTVDVIKCLAEQPLEYEPGTKWQYSLGHDVLAALVEVVSGEKFSEYVKKNIFEPVGMTKSFYHETPEILDKMAEQYEYITEGEKLDFVEAQIRGNSKGGYWKNIGKYNSHVFSHNYDSGGAGIITTVPDYAKFANCLAEGGLAKTGERILSKGTIDLLRTNQLTPELMPYFSWEQLLGYGYGLGVRTCIDKSVASSCGSIGEFGWGGAAGATILVDPDTHFSYFYAHHMCNPQEGYYQPRLRNAAYSSFCK